jgi:hypothetical protein
MNANDYAGVIVSRVVPPRHVPVRLAANRYSRRNNHPNDAWVNRLIRRGILGGSARGRFQSADRAVPTPRSHDTTNLLSA